MEKLLQNESFRMKQALGRFGAGGRAAIANVFAQVGKSQQSVQSVVAFNGGEDAMGLVKRRRMGRRMLG
jgi:hypothetical protein